MRLSEALAFCDSRGVFYETAVEFPALMAAVWPDWRVFLEAPRGLRLQGATLHLAPCLPMFRLPMLTRIEF